MDNNYEKDAAKQYSDFNQKEALKEAAQQKREVFENMRRELEIAKQELGQDISSKVPSMMEDTFEDAEINEFGEIIRPGR